ncbi:MAG: hypothetical protein IJ146_14685 [Kiritimatiellae bacterium]|nr:hypothetical protein [Kiritimatiellia bacterium]
MSRKAGFRIRTQGETRRVAAWRGTGGEAKPQAGTCCAGRKSPLAIRHASGFSGRA